MPVPSESRMRAAIDWANCGDDWLAWKQVKPITKENLIKGTGCIQLLPPNTRIGEERPEESGKLIPLGKYRGRAVDWVKQNDPNYWSWAVTNIAVFSKL